MQNPKHKKPCVADLDDDSISSHMTGESLSLGERNAKESEVFAFLQLFVADTED